VTWAFSTVGAGAARVHRAQIIGEGLNAMTMPKKSFATRFTGRGHVFDRVFNNQLPAKAVRAI
jgi:hypothetical protein